MTLWNTNKLRISIDSARKYQLDRKWSRITRFRSDDHDRTNDPYRGLEHNWSIVFGPLWLFVKYRPSGR